MSNISGTETKPEVIVRKFLFSNGFRYRKNVKTLPGKPDIVLPKYKTVIFVHGCFWHNHKRCKKSKLPETRKAFWQKKILGNAERDKRNIRKLRKDGWIVIIVWQCQIANNTKMQKRFDLLVNEIVEKNKKGSRLS